LLRSNEEITRAFESRTDLIAQPFLDPPSNMDALIAPFVTGLPFFFSFPENGQYVVTVIIGPDGSMSEPYAWLCSLTGGQSTYGTRCDDLELLDVCRAYARAAAAEGWRGPLNVQLKRTAEGRFVAFELNGRFGGGTAARTCLGFDEVGDAISRFVPDAAFASSAAPESDAVQKYLRSYPIPREGLNTLQLTGAWARRPEKPTRVARAKAPKLRLLVLSVGSLAAQKLIDALGTRRERCVLIGTNSIAQTSANFRCDTVYLVPQASSTDYIDRIAQIIQQERPDIVIPARDDDVLALAVVGERYPPPDQCVLLTGSVAAARMINDKLQTARFAARHALPFAETADNVEAALVLARRHGHPIIGKPRSGNATRGVVLLRSAEEIERAFESNSDFLVQVLLDPPTDTAALTMPYSAGLPFFFSFPETAQYFLQIVVGPDGSISEPLGTLSTQVGGKAIRTERCADPELLSIGRAYARATADEGWRGPLNVQLKRAASGSLVAHELNGRFSGGTAARVYLGFDEIGEMIKRFLPAVAFPSLSGSECDVVQNYMYTEPIPREDLETLLSTGRWSRTQA
ncbi:MAG TPA: hypothetical protein VFI62_17010, partial [Burkholderiales bacterium]|nr:hypothetical protein [Burkholderiales bacterium]